MRVLPTLMCGFWGCIRVAPVGTTKLMKCQLGSRVKRAFMVVLWLAVKVKSGLLLRNTPLSNQPANCQPRLALANTPISVPAANIAGVKQVSMPATMPGGPCSGPLWPSAVTVALTVTPGPKRA